MIDLLCTQSHECGAAITAANTGVKVDGKTVYEKKRMGRYYSAIRLQTETKQALLLKVGVPLSPEVVNKAAFIFLSQRRVSGTCSHCSRRPVRGSGLNFWTRDTKGSIPLPLMMAWGGATVEKIKEILPICDMRCRTCAKKRGAQLLNGGYPDLRAYDVDVI